MKSLKDITNAIFGLFLMVFLAIAIIMPFYVFLNYMLTHYGDDGLGIGAVISVTLITIIAIKLSELKIR